ncbi:MAG: NUDIX hydrolase [Nitrococcus mobilis]|nr:NUDIX hydrolase [Nitrococcus mobilis]
MTVWKPHVTVAAVVEHANRFLMVEETAEGRRVLNQPAGHLEPGESLLEAMVRETREETGWEVEGLALVGIYRWPHPKRSKTFLRVAFAARALSHNPDHSLDEGIVNTHWLTCDELTAAAERLRSPLVLQSATDYLAGRRYPLELLRDLE